jgi:hypothetical protein
MRQRILALLGALAVVALLGPVAAQAGTLPAGQARAGAAAAASGNTLTTHRPAAQKALSRHITLPKRECAALLRHPAGCTMSEGIHLIRASAAGDFYSGYLQACAKPYNTGGCDTHYWWVTDSFNFTANGSQVWGNGTPQCASNHTAYTWCSDVGNGTGTLQEGFNFGNGGWARMDLNAHDVYDLYQCGVRGPSWANVTGYAIDQATDGEVFCIQE